LRIAHRHLDAQGRFTIERGFIDIDLDAIARQFANRIACHIVRRPEASAAVVVTYIVEALPLAGRATGRRGGQLVILDQDFLQIGLGQHQALLAQHGVGGADGDAGHGVVERGGGDADDDDGDHQLHQSHARLPVHVHRISPVSASMLMQC